MRKFEYISEEYSTDRPADIDETLKEWGGSGWEVVAASYVRDARDHSDSPRIMVFYKREKLGRIRSWLYSL